MKKISYCVNEYGWHNENGYNLCDFINNTRQVDQGILLNIFNYNIIH